MNTILKVNCLFNLSMIAAALYFIARARFETEIRKHIEHKFAAISYGAGLVAVCSWYLFYFNAKLLLFENVHNMSDTMKTVLTLHAIINVVINVIVWYIFFNSKKRFI